MQILGIQILGPFLQTAVLEIDGKKRANIRSLKMSPLQEFLNVKRLYIQKTVAGIEASQLIIRELEVPVVKSHFLEEALRFQSEGASFLNPKEVISVAQIISQKEGKTKAALYIATRDSIRECLAQLKKEKIDPDTISAAPLAIQQYAQWKTELEDLFVIHLGPKEWVCIDMERGFLRKAHVILGGNELLLSLLWEDRKKILLQKEIEGAAKQIDLLQLKPHLYPHLFKKLTEMRRQLSLALHSFQRAGKPYFFTGNIDVFDHYTLFLAEEFKEAVSCEIKSEATVEELRYAIPIGLCLEPPKMAPQFRREEFFPEKNWKQAGLYATLLFVFSLLLSFAFLSGGEWLFSSRKGQMIERLKLLLENQDPFIRSDEDILSDWINTVEQYSKETPYISHAPKVAEFLSWLSQHPLFKKMALRDLTYQLVQYPHIGSLEEPYRVKVELEFDAESPRDARDLHQALLKGDEMVDPRKEIGWETLNTGFRTTFFLKNRRPHVP